MLVSGFFRQKQNIIPLAFFSLFTLYAICSKGVLDEGDAVMHFLIARFSLSHPHLLLDLWGKPLFTLLVTPFTVFGFNGVIFFNAIVGTSAAYITYLFAKQLKISGAYLVIPVMLFSPVYFRSVLAGHTEILCSLGFVFTAYMSLKKKYSIASIVASFLPFIRPEGYIILFCVAIAIIRLSQYRNIPLLFVGFFTYSLIGYFHFNDILWVFNESPYTYENGIYGHGDLWHFIRSYRGIVGNPIVFILCTGILYFLASPFLKKHKSFINNNELTVIMMGSLVLVVAAHSYMWWKGIFGSFGLIRVVTCVLPSLTILWLFGWNIIDKYLLSKVPQFKFIPVVLYFSLVAYVPLKNYGFPIQAKKQQQLLEKVASWYKQNADKKAKVYYQHPYLIYALGIDPFDDTKTGMIWSLNKAHPGNGITAGSLLFWDGKFSPVEGGITLPGLLKDNRLQLIKTFKPNKEILEMWGTPFEVYVFSKF